MEPVQNWTKEYFFSNQHECRQKIKELSADERTALKWNLDRCETNKIVLLTVMITDMCEPELYCEKYEVKSADGSVVRVESAKFSDVLNLGEGETVEDPTKFLNERQTFLLSKPASTNQWVYDVEPSMMENGNKRKAEESQEPEKSFVVKVYETTDITMNRMVEVVGFLSSSSKKSPDAMESEDFTEESQDLPALTVHAISFKEIPHNNPLLLNNKCDEIQPEEIQKDLLKVLTQFMFGDELAAQYVLCHLISNIYGRVSGEVLGKFTLNLICSAVPKDLLLEHVKKFYNFIEMLVPDSVYLPMTIENLNTMSFVPKKDYKTNRLQSGILQLPKHSHLVLDETKLQTGKLETAGCMAVADLTELINSQQLSYDFGFYKIPFHTNIPVLIFGEGKSLLPSDFIVPINADEDSIKLLNENIAAGVHFLKPKLNALRKYLTECRVCDFEIGENESKVIENDFVKMREERKIEVENLHSLIVISRLVGISRGMRKLDLSAWETAKKLETERINRVEKRAGNKPEH